MRSIASSPQVALPLTARLPLRLRHEPLRALSTSLLYTGEQRDGDSSFYYLRARYYDPSIGRFLTGDPFRGWVASPHSQNPYAYVMNNPANLTDPTGLCVLGLPCPPPPPPVKCLLDSPHCAKRTAQRVGGAAGEVLRVVGVGLGQFFDALEYWRELRYGRPSKQGDSMTNAMENAWDWLTSRSPDCYARTLLFSAYCGGVAAEAGSGVGAVYAVGSSTMCGQLFVGMINACGE